MKMGIKLGRLPIMAKNKEHKRLLADIKPERYKLTIHPDFKNHTFSGEETIFLTFRKASKKIVLHSVNLKISDVFLKIASRKIKPDKISYNNDKEIVILLFARICPIGKGELSLKFRGKLGNDMRGFYKSRYEHKGEEKYLATTQF